MLSKEIINKIKHIQITTRRLLSGSQSGDCLTKQKGYGLEFDQLREYQTGDDVRFIDWKSSARSNKLLLKEYREERNRAVMLLVDISKSSFFGSGKQRKADVMADIASALALAADYAKDAVGLILFSDKIDYFMPPARGKHHVMALMKEVYSAQAHGNTTTINAALQLLGQLKRTDTIAFLISDCIDESYEKQLHVINARYDLVVIRCLDEREQRLPKGFHIQLQDIETGQELFIKSDVLKISAERIQQQNKYFKKYGIDCFDVSCDKSYINDLVMFFQRRISGK